MIHRSQGLKQLAMQDELKRVLGHYDFGELTTAHRVEHGFVNENWVVETTSGKYFLKRRHPDLRNLDLVCAQHALTMHLRQLGFPAPAILPRVSGETLLVLDGELYEIQEYISGTPYDHTRAPHFRAAAAMLAVYHLCVQDFADQRLCDPGRLYCPTLLGANLSILAANWKLGQDTILVQLVKELESHAADLASCLTPCEELPQLIIHGDFHAANLLFKGDCVVGVLDYDKARWQPRVVELAEALIYFASPRPGHMKYLVYPGFLEWDKFTCFLQDYARVIRFGEMELGRESKPLLPAFDTLRTASSEVACLEAKEVCALPDYIRAIWLCISVERLFERDFRRAEIAKALHELLTLADWATVNRQRLIEACYAAINVSMANSPRRPSA